MHAFGTENAIASPKLHGLNHLHRPPKNFRRLPLSLAHPVLYIASVEEWDARPDDTNADGCIGREVLWKASKQMR